MEWLVSHGWYLN